MDVAVLRGRIASTLDPDADARRRAELDLKSVSIPNKFLFQSISDQYVIGRRTSRFY